MWNSVRTTSSAVVERLRGATLYVIENFATLLKVIKNETAEYSMCKLLLVFHCNYVSFLYCFSDI